MKKQSVTLKKNTDASNFKVFWSKEWRDLTGKQRKAEEELEAALTTLDIDADLQALLGRDSGALRQEQRKIATASEKQVDAVWGQLKRFQTVCKDLRRGLKRPARELEGLSSEVIAFIEETGHNLSHELIHFRDRNREVGMLERDVRDGDRVRGFDLEDCLDAELLVDFNRFEGLADEEEQGMIDNYYSGCDMLAQKRNLEIQVIEQQDVVLTHIAHRPFQAP